MSCRVVAHHGDRSGEQVGELEVVEAHERDRVGASRSARSAPTVLRLFAQNIAVGRRSGGRASSSATTCSACAASCAAGPDQLGASFAARASASAAR